MLGERKIVAIPDGARAVAQRARRIDNTMIKLIARGYRWHRLLSSGAYTSIDELAAAEKIDGSYVSQVLRLAYLSPTIVEAILAVRYPPQLTAKDLLKPIPMDWREQESHLTKKIIWPSTERN
jgi:hypothetical protein